MHFSNNKSHHEFLNEPLLPAISFLKEENSFIVETYKQNVVRNKFLHLNLRKGINKLVWL